MKTVFVGLSGGVDSAVSAALLKERGWDVIGVFIKIWRPEFIECTWKEDRLDAMRVAAALEIPFREVDLSDEYKKEVVDSMLANYARGVTPNPDVVCNKEIKFGSFFRWAREHGADMIATGHYARIENVRPTRSNILLRGRDASKDQSYFLHQLNGADLDYILFPIGDMEKSEVRRYAARFDLPVATRPDSQGLCFVGDVTMSEFLGRFIPLKSGPIIDIHGEIVGEHDGAALYTIGQRHGFKTFKSGEPYYVTRVDAAKNTIFVSHIRADGAVASVCIDTMHIIDGSEVDQQVVPARALTKQVVPARALTKQVVPARAPVPESACAQVRYRETSIPVTIKKNSDGWHITFETPHIAAPGQSLVLYDGERCLGGGTISR